MSHMDDLTARLPHDLGHNLAENVAADGGPRIPRLPMLPAHLQHALFDARQRIADAQTARPSGPTDLD
jgi:hypothetical protein